MKRFHLDMDGYRLRSTVGYLICFRPALGINRNKGFLGGGFINPNVFVLHLIMPMRRMWSTVAITCRTIKEEHNLVKKKSPKGWEEAQIRGN